MSGNFEEFVMALKSVNDKPYFWGKISREEAENILSERPVGSYLIREMDEPKKIVIRRFEFEENFETLVKLETGTYSITPLCLHCADITVDTLVPVNRNRPYSLQELCRTKILGTGITEDGIAQLEFPESLKRFLKGLGCHRHEIPEDFEGESQKTK